MCLEPRTLCEGVGDDARCAEQFSMEEVHPGCNREGGGDGKKGGDWLGVGAV